MNQSPEKSLFNLTGKSSFEEIGIEELEKITNEHPYFSVGHLLLAKRLNTAQNDRFLQHAQKAAVYIPDTLWLQFQLDQQAQPYIASAQEEAPAMEAVIADDGQLQPHDIAAEPAEVENVSIHHEPEVLLTDGDDNISTDELLHTSTLLQPAFKDVSATALPQPEPAAEAFTTSDNVADEATETAERRIEDEPVAITEEFTLEEIETADNLAHETLAETETVEEDRPEVTEFVPITTEFSKEELDESGDLALKTLADVDEQDETFVLPDPLPETEEAPANDIVPVEIVERTIEMPAPPPGEAEFLAEEELSEDADETNIGPEEEVNAGEFSNQQMLKNIKSILDTPVSPEQETLDQGIAVPIDPYYTVDYFASQGIKLVLETEPQDKLGKQLRSFTQWLKHMKKLGPEDAIEEENEKADEANVIRIADFSNIQREVVTEAMAEVLEKQGKKEKAVQVYIKLSFLHPSKSAYFADKIKTLKGLK